MAQAGMKILLAGVDLEGLSPSGSVEEKNRPGLTGILLENNSWRNEIKSLANIMNKDERTNILALPDLHIIASGTGTPNSLKQIDSTRLESFVNEIREAYDIVIFGTSASTSATDPLVLGTEVDAVLLVSNENNETEGLPKELEKQLIQSDCNIIGMVINDVKLVSYLNYGAHIRGYVFMIQERPTA